MLQPSTVQVEHLHCCNMQGRVEALETESSNIPILLLMSLLDIDQKGKMQVITSERGRTAEEPVLTSQALRHCMIQETLFSK